MANIPSCSSPLASYYVPGNNIYDRHVDGWDGTIDTVTIHCYVGQVTAKQGVDAFSHRSDEASTNYVVGKDGEIGLSVPESNRTACTTSRANDKRAVTIEVASDSKHPYAVTPEAYNALIELVVDICRRNNIKKLIWSDKKEDRVNRVNGCNMTVHRDYSSKSCPGQYLYDLHGQIAATVNSKLAPVVSNFCFNEIAATELDISFTASDYFKDYSWSYTATPVAGDPICGSLALTDETVNFKIRNLKPNMLYDINIITKDSYDNIMSSPAFKTMTAKDYPGEIKNIDVSFNYVTADTKLLTIQITQPSFWGSIQHNDSGYRVILYSNGKEIFSSDSILVRTNNSITILFSENTEGFFNQLLGIHIPYESTFQVGISTWLADTGQPAVFNLRGPVCSEGIYLQYPIKPVDKAFVKVDGKHEQVMLYGTHLSNN